MSTQQQVTLVYAGRRLDKNDKTIHAWFLEERALYFAKIPGVSIGGCYEVQADIEGDGVSIYGGTLHYTGEKISDVDQIALWQVEDQHTRTTTVAKAAERRHGKSTELDEALEPLLRIVRLARTQAEMEAIVRVVESKATRAWWRR